MKNSLDMKLLLQSQFALLCALYFTIGEAFVRQFPASVQKSSLKVAGKSISAKRDFKLTRLFATVEDVKEEKFSFESNVSRVMDIIINSLYSNKDVFLRELISNAADACDKKRFLSITEGGSSSAEDLRIRVSTDRAKNTLTIQDSGIGMDKEDLVQNLGKIAESGTKRFMEATKDSKDADMSLIGQFGVGFYSGFLVADRMTVITKGKSGEQLRWTASADSLDQYAISADPDAASAPIEGTGTRIILHLKDESDQYLDDVALRALIEKYSEFIPFPIE